MPLVEALFFGFIQGITEFLPISSTAHIVITELVLGYQFPGLAFEIYLHIASVFAVLIYFRRDLSLLVRGFLLYCRKREAANRAQFRFGLYLIAATVITGVLGLLLSDIADAYMKTPPFISGGLVVTGTALILIERCRSYGHREVGRMRWADALIVGLAQTVAVLPGISRSGATVIAGLWAGLERETAVRFSFLLVIPVILGSTVLAAEDVAGVIHAEIGSGPLLVSFLASFLFSLVGIAWLIDFLRKGRLLYFAIYCYVLAILVFFFVKDLPPGV